MFSLSQGNGKSRAESRMEAALVRDPQWALHRKEAEASEHEKSININILGIKM